MKRLCLFLFLCIPVVAQAQTQSDSLAIIATAMNYMEGWYMGDGDRMAQALHPELAKRAQLPSPQNGALSYNHMTADQLTRATRSGMGTRTPEARQQKDAVILDIFGNTASVKAIMADWIDYMHMMKVNDEWKIVNVLWELKPKS